MSDPSPDPMTTVRLATAADAAQLTALFEDYCRFYERPPAPGGAAAFIGERLRLGDSHAWLAWIAGDPDIPAGAAIGFAQLYPKFSSTSMRRDWLLNDLYVAAPARRRGVAKALLDAVGAFARESGAARIQLKTHHTNTTAQQLYEKLGWQRDDRWHTYNYDLT